MVDWTDTAVRQSSASRQDPDRKINAALGTGFRDSTPPRNRDTEVIQVHFCEINTAIAMPSRPSCG